LEGIVSGVPDVLRFSTLGHNYNELSAEELLGVCADLRNTAAWDELIRRFHSLIYVTVMRAGKHYQQFHRGLCDDLEQETYLRLSAQNARALREFMPRHPGSAYKYVQVIAVRVTQDYCKKKDFTHLQELPANLPEIAAPDETEWLALKSEIGAALRTHATPRDRQIFQLHYLQGLTAAEIAAIPQIKLGVKGVEAVLWRLREMLKDIHRE
jgi:RNA polymerase sigma factor (sigma-70 family)